MGMLMYEDMKVSVLQLFLVRKKISRAVGDSSLLFHMKVISKVFCWEGGQGNLLSVEKSGVAAG